MKIEQVEAILRKIQSNMEGLKEYGGGIIDEFDYDRENPEESFKADVYRQVLDKLGDIKWN